MRLGCILLLLLSFTISSAQLSPKPTDSTTIWKTFKYDANSSWRGIKHSVTRPLHWKGKDFAKFGSLFVGTAIIATADRQTSDFFINQEQHLPHGVKEFGFYFAKPQYYFAMNAGVYGVGLFTKNEQIRKTGVLIISSSITAGYLQIMARSAFGRARPYSGKDPYTFKPFEGTEEYFSFPSGHTVLGMTVAHSIAKQFDNTWVKVGIYSVGSLPAISRMVNGSHWLSDVAFGAAFSIFVVDGIDKFLFKEKLYDYPIKPKLVTWNLKFSGSQIGIVGTF
ncbi:MAG: phosphatase PAP2 family protein [Cellulophaga fucicola]